jgi:CubicO group peptidase (beta-lactamase class C family)
MRISKKIILFSTILGIFVVSIFSMNGMQQEIDNCIRSYVDSNSFSGSVLVAKNGKVLFKKAYGMACYEKKIKNTSKTKFWIASCSKQFTALAIMQLCEKDLLHLNDPIKKHLPEYSFNKKITIHHLLTHTSGMADYYDFVKVEDLNKCFCVQEIIKTFTDRSLIFKPGAGFMYSNSGYVLLSYIIERVSKEKSYAKYMQNNIFKPVVQMGMFSMKKKKNLLKKLIVLKNTFLWEMEIFALRSKIFIYGIVLCMEKN